MEYGGDARHFIKRSPVAPDMFSREAEGLQALAATGLFRIPEVIEVSEDRLVLERIERARKQPGFAESFGRKVARLHQVRGKTSGYSTDNYIGDTPQRNDPLDSSWEEAPEDDGRGWPEFFVERRLRFQANLAIEKGRGDEFARLLDKGEPHILELLEASIEPPGLLHGDLWAGNYLVDDQGAPCLIDPAVYYGHREAELAMTRLFGGFEAAFYAAYQEAWPLKPGHEARLEIYQLYHVLNHANLFGGGYHGQAMSIFTALTR
jgi:fructosamine-3-kinase